MDLLHDLTDPLKWSSDPDISLLYVSTGKGFYGKYNPDSTMLFSKKHLTSFNNRVDIVNLIKQKKSDLEEFICIELILNAVHYQEEMYLLPRIEATNNPYILPMVLSLFHD